MRTYNLPRVKTVLRPTSEQTSGGGATSKLSCQLLPLSLEQKWLSVLVEVTGVVVDLVHTERIDLNSHGAKTYPELEVMTQPDTSSYVYRRKESWKKPLAHLSQFQKAPRI